MDYDIASSRGRAARLCTVSMRLSALLAAGALLLAALPTIAAAHGRRSSGHPKRGSGRRLAAPRFRRTFVVRRQALLARRVGRLRGSGVDTGTRLQVRDRSSATRARRCVDAHTRVGRVSRPELQRAVVCLVNRQRRAHGLPGLRANPRLDRSAQIWTNTMVRHRAFSHGSDFSARISAVGFDWSHIGENIAAGYRTPATVVAAWMASTGHCQNILNPIYREVGTGVDDRSAVGSDGTGTWTQDFGLLMNQHLASDNWTPAAGCPYG